MVNSIMRGCEPPATVLESRVMRNPLENYVGFHLVRTANLGLKILNEGYGDLGIRHMDAAIMLVIDANPGITQSSIGRMLRIQRSNMVPIITRLSDRGWIERKAGRGKMIGIYLSDAGVEAIPRIRAVSEQAEVHLREPIGKQAYDRLLETLCQIS